MDDGGPADVPTDDGRSGRSDPEHRVPIGSTIVIIVLMTYLATSSVRELLKHSQTWAIVGVALATFVLSVALPELGRSVRRIWRSATEPTGG